MKKFWGLVTSLIIGLALLGCSEGNEANTDGQIHVVTTIAQIGDAVINIGGEHVDVISLMGPGTDPHMYNAVQSDIEKMANADIIFYNGLELEGQMDDVFAQMGKQKPTVPVGEKIEQTELLIDPDNPSVYDPHIWFNIDLFSQVVEVIRDQLIEIDPDHAADYQENAATYLTELDELSEYVFEQIEQIPEESRVLVTAHDAFHYFGEAYGFEVVGIQGLSTESDYSVHDIQSIVDLVTEREIKAIFIESSVSDRSINAVIEGAKATGHEVTIGGELYSDAMGEAGTEDGTYIGMFKSNINTIVDALK